MKAVCLCVLLGLALAVAHSEETYKRDFIDFMKKFNKKYETSELFYRFEVYKANIEKIATHNAKSLTWTMGTNQFMDLSEDEFGKLYLKGLLPRNSIYRNGVRKSSCSSDTLPAAAEDVIDWVEKGAVTAVKDQGQCGSCWSFSTTGAVEGTHFVEKGNLVTLSEQQLMDCSWSYGNMGCNGGLMDNGFEYLIDNGGSCLESEYPYTGESSHTCKPCTPVATINKCFDVTAKDQKALKNAVFTRPIAIAIEADQKAFQFYSGGVMTGRCGENLDHGVLVVGYDFSYSTPYWKVKNSWGPSWGEEGYIKIEVSGDKCGVMDSPSYST